MTTTNRILRQRTGHALPLPRRRLRLFLWIQRGWMQPFPPPEDEAPVRSLAPTSPRHGILSPSLNVLRRHRSHP